MTSPTNHQDQQHPRGKHDHELVERLFQEGSSDRNLAELARLRIRYRNFPGASDLKRDLNLLLQQWQLSEEQLYGKTRQLHASGQVYQRPKQGENDQDWS